MKKRAISFGLILSVLGSLTACGGDGSGGNDDLIKIGIITPLTGNAAAYGSGFWLGVQAAENEINKSGGVLVNGKRHKVKATVCDDQFVPSKSVSCGQKLSDSLMIYTPATQSSFPLMGFNQKDDFILMSTSQTPTFTAQGNKLVVRSTYNLERQIPDLARLVGEYAKKEKLTLKSVAIMEVGSDFGPAFTDTFSKAWKLNGGTITGTASYDTVTTDLTSQLTSLLRGNPDAIAITTVCQSAALVMDQARHLGFKGTFINAVCAGGPGMTKYMSNSQLVGSNVSTVKSNAFDSIPVVGAFHKKYSDEKYKSALEQQILEFGYFGVEWFAKAVSVAGTTSDSAKVHAALEPALGRLQPNILGITKYFPDTGDIEMTTFLAQTKPDGRSFDPLAGQN
ncbi:ABC transporter substrate-binding protein [Spongiactinospora sp. TRM90649]|uniref:ABC transporter substrate-binding protein n=1 Tax=Spongiactinospora sp. TRM90649 TaxID=3031114 RepID=UPI0023FA09A6|nr:ABC transporter substrate-binding protein [Spongiactinospora sp. TRM90649]MDF5756313.1 ABC transporter substrate-binding protein [Spongiactinospora sp. TRM90649]